MWMRWWWQEEGLALLSICFDSSCFEDQQCKKLKNYPLKESYEKNNRGLFMSFLLGKETSACYWNCSSFFVAAEQIFTWQFVLLMEKVHSLIFF